MPLLSRADAAKFLGVSIASFDRHVRRQLPERKVGRLPRFRSEDLEAWAEAEKVEAHAPPAGRPTDPLPARTQTPPADPELLTWFNRKRRTTARERIAIGTGTPEDVEHVRKLDARYSKSLQRRGHKW